MPDIGRSLIVFGLILVMIGVAVTVAGRIPYLGHLPGDIMARRGNVSFYFPIVTCIVISLALTVLLNLMNIILRH